MVFEDLNGNSVQDPTDSAVSGATVTLLEAATGSPVLDVNGIPVPSQTTGSDGTYFFDNLAPGDYIVQVAAPAGLLPVPVQTPLDDNAPADSNIAVDLGGNVFQSPVITLAPGTEPIDVDPTLAGDSQDDAADANGDMTVDFGFFVPAPAIDIVKTAGTAPDGTDLTIAPLGGDVVYTYVVTNTGNTYLSNIFVEDDAGTPAVPADDVTVTSCTPALAGQFAPGDSTTCTATLQVAVNTTNIAETSGNPTLADGTDIPGLPDPTDDDDAVVVLSPVINPQIDLEKTIDGEPIDNGDGTFTITFNLVVTNTGQADLLEIQLVDDLIAAVNTPTPNNGTVSNASVTFISGTPLTPNPAYTGTGINEMLVGTDPFPVGSQGTIQVQFDFTPDGELGAFENTATVTGVDGVGVVLDDASSALFTVLVPTVPISLGEFTATPEANGTVLRWTTQSEVANVGFNLYARINDEWVGVNDSLILSQGDSIALQHYEFRTPLRAPAFSIGDVDLEGVETLHGPFLLGETHGTIGERRGIDWSAEKGEREAKQAERDARRKELQRERTERNMKKIMEGDTSSLFEQLNKPFAQVASVVLSAMISSAHAQESIDWVNLATTEEGVTEVSYEALANYGVDLSGLPANEISVVNQGQSVPIQVLGGDTFGSGSSIRFVAKSIDTLYTNENIYTLRSGGDVVTMSSAATPISTRAPFATSYLSSAKFAPQANYSFTSPDETDPWFATRLVSIDEPVSEVVALELDNVAVGGNNGSTQAKMNVNVWGATDLPGGNDHRMRISFNGKSIMDETFDGLTAQSFEMSLDSVNEGRNSVTLELPTQVGVPLDVVNVDEVEVQYPRQFIAEDNRLSFSSRFTKFLVRGFTPNATDASGNPSLDFVVLREDADGNVEEVSNAVVLCNIECSVVFGGTGQVETYYVSANAYNAEPAALVAEENITSGLARYLIISHPDFIGEAGNNQLEALANELASEMGSADIVDVEQIYAQFGGHVFDPTAIKRYIEHAYNNRGTRYVMLVGGDIYDYRQFENDDATSFIPSLYAATGTNVTFAPVDPKYVDLDDDNVPDLPIGRLPVRTTAQLTALMNKRAAFVNRDYAGTALFVADTFDEIQQYDFAGDAQTIANTYLGNFDVTTAFVDELGTRPTRNLLTNEINQGTTLTSFFGHSSTNQWSFDGLLTGNDAAGLSNVGRPTVVTQWGCWNAYYVSPEEDSMGHRFLMEGEQGAVSVMGATTLTSASAERALAKLVFARLANGERLGDAVTGAKQEYATTNPDDLDVLLGWTILGMPELFIN